MKKFLCTIFLLSWCVPASSQAEGYLNMNESFTLAKSVKVGREKSKMTVGDYQRNLGKKAGDFNRVKNECSSGCRACDYKTGTCSECHTGMYLEGNECISCPENNDCNGKEFACLNGYYAKEPEDAPKSCESCASALFIANGTCTSCSNAEQCTAVTCNAGATKSGSSMYGVPSCVKCSSLSVSNGICSECTSAYHHSSYTPVCSKAACNSGYYADGGSCRSCSSISVTNGICTACNDGTKCTSVVCNSGATESGSTMYGNIPSCVKCSSISVTNGECTECTSAYHSASYTPVCKKASCNKGYYADGNTCVACSSVYIANGTCQECSNGTKCTKASCNSGYYAEGGSCKSCSKISVSHGTCTECSNSSTCTKASCNTGYYADGGSCKSCSNVSVSHGTCTECSNSTTCTAMNCNTNYAYRQKRAGVWEAGCYPKGTCPKVRPDASGATCMDVGNNTWQCKKDDWASSSICVPCTASGYREGPGNGGPYYDYSTLVLSSSQPKCSSKGKDNSWKVKSFGNVSGKTCYACTCDGPVLQDGTCCKKGYITRGGYISCEPDK